MVEQVKGPLVLEFIGIDLDGVCIIMVTILSVGMGYRLHFDVCPSDTIISQSIGTRPSNKMEGSHPSSCLKFSYFSP